MNKKHKSPFMEIVRRECKPDGKGRYKTADVIRVAQRTYNEQQQVITALKQHLNSITRKH
jgi:hypothetical protein